MKINVKDIQSNHMCNAAATRIIPAINEMWDKIQRLEKALEDGVKAKQAPAKEAKAPDESEVQETPKRRGRRPKGLGDAKSV